MDYNFLRQLHISCAAISIALFALRWTLDCSGRSWRQWRWLRIAPHANDTVLLTAAIGLAAWSHQYPWQLPWLGAKVLLLLLYIGLGKRALRPALPRTIRMAWGLAALTTASCIVLLAVQRPVHLPL